jgi:hypothetical protein
MENMLSEPDNETVIMKITTGIIISLFLLGACGQLTHNSPKQLNSIKDDRLDISIVQSIKDYYQDIYGEATRLEEAADNTTVALSYFITTENEEENDGRLIVITIPLIRDQDLWGAKPILEGDLNNDLKNDLVITVHTEFGNSAAQEIFVFINEQENFRLATVTGHQDLSGCNGYFWARRIENNLIIGNSSCFAAEDAMCCPSLHYQTKVAFDSNELKFVSKRSIP